MNRTTYVARYAVLLLLEGLVWASFGALSWTAVLDANTFVTLLEHGHYSLGVLIALGVCAYVALTTIAIPTLHDMRWHMTKNRQLAIANAARAQERQRLELLVQTDINSDADARKVLRFTKTMRGHR